MEVTLQEEEISNKEEILNVGEETKSFPEEKAEIGTFDSSDPSEELSAIESRDTLSAEIVSDGEEEKISNMEILNEPENGLGKEDSGSEDTEPMIIEEDEENKSKSTSRGIFQRIFLSFLLICSQCAFRRSCFDSSRINGIRINS